MKIVPVLVVALVPASLALAIAFGSVDLGPAQLADALLFRGDEIARALVGLMLSLAPSSQVQGMLFWLLGDLSPAADPSVALIVLAACTALAFSQSAALDVLILGEDKALARRRGGAAAGHRLRLRDPF